MLRDVWLANMFKKHYMRNQNKITKLKYTYRTICLYLNESMRSLFLLLRAGVMHI